MKRPLSFVAAALLAAGLIVPAFAQTAPATPTLNHFSTVQTGITPQNVTAMHLAWHFTTPADVSATPLYYRGNLYFGDWAGYVYSVNAQTGRLNWKRKLENPQMTWPWHGFAGTGVIADNMLYLASVEGYAYAINLTTHRTVWQSHFALTPYSGDIGPLLYARGAIYIGLASVDEPLSQSMKGFTVTFHGNVVALNATNGTVVWRRMLVQAPHNGIAVWGGFAYNAASNTLYFATGNNYTGSATGLSDAMVAVNAGTGKIKWFHQVTAHDVWVKAHPTGPDYDFGAPPALWNGPRNGGKPRLLVGAGTKNGYFYAFNARTGALAFATPVGYGGVAGGIRAPVSVGARRILVWSNNGWNDGSNGAKAANYPITIKALSLRSGKVLWTDAKAAPAVAASGGFLAGQVYFVGSLDGKIRAFSATSGKTLWTSPATGSVTSNLTVHSNMLYFGTSVPKSFGGYGPNGVWAFTLG